MNQNTQFDYIIVGAGSAGCVLANRLIANPDNRVCLLEAGPEDRNALIHTPIGIAALLQDAIVRGARVVFGGEVRVEDCFV